MQKGIIYFICFCLSFATVVPCSAQSQDQTGKVVIKEETSKVKHIDSEKKKKEVKETTKSSPDDGFFDDLSLTDPVVIGAGVGAVLLVGGAIALGSGGSSSSSDSSSTEPPTADSLVGAWQAGASQLGSGLTYTGTYQLFQGGGVAYDIYVSDGEHLVGGGSWRINEYQLSIHTDHGSLYQGSFTPGNYNTVSLVANTYWTLTLTR